jgi:hypothetical protein
MKSRTSASGGKRSRRSRAAAALLRVALVAGAWTASSCAPSGFATETLVNTVRILASSSQPAYAQPGSTVTVQVLAFDGRPTKAESMNVYWVPLVCEDPANDAYFSCFQQLAGGDAGAPAAGDGGAASAGIGALKPGVDLTPFLPDAGPSFQFPMPADVVTRHTPVPGEASPYGLAILFNVACAGHLELLPPDPSSDNPQRVPLACFDANENQVGPDDWVLGFTRVYAFAPDAGANGVPITNANPIVSSIDIAGSQSGVMPASDTIQYTARQPFVVTHCAADGPPCQAVSIGPVVPDRSWELTQQIDANGNPQHEEIWADFYSSLGQLSAGTTLLYDATQGSVGGPSVTDLQFTPPRDPGSGLLWIVVHDSRGGASWVTVDVTVL